MPQSGGRIVGECLPRIHKAPDSVPTTVDEEDGGEEEEEGKLVEGRKRGLELALFP